MKCEKRTQKTQDNITDRKKEHSRKKCRMSYSIKLTRETLSSNDLTGESTKI